MSNDVWHEHVLLCVQCVDDWKPEMGLKDPYWSPTSPTTADHNLITSTESETGMICISLAKSMNGFSSLSRKAITRGRTVRFSAVVG